MPIQEVQITRDDDGKIQVNETNGLAAWGRDQQFNIVGKPQTRLEGPEKVTGRARYSYDIRLPGQLYAAVLRSPHPHARIRSIDTSKAEALDGVHAVISSANLAELDADDVTVYKEKSPLFSETVRFVGEEVAAVAAQSEQIARDALALIEVDYEVLPFVTDMQAALASDAPVIHEESEGEGNRAGEVDSYARGDVETALDEADVIVDEIYTTQTHVHNALETHGCTALWAGDELTLYNSTQGIFSVREAVAEKLGLSLQKVQVITEHMGGGFGAKQIPWKPTLIAALLSKQSGRPVQLMLDRTGESLAAGNRGATRQHVRLAAKRDGTLTAIAVEASSGVGAYRVGGEASMVAGMYKHLYACPNVSTAITSVYTNTGPAVAFRAPGYVEACFALESAMDQLAHQLEMEPVELRLKNYTERDQTKEQPYTSPETLRIAYERATESFGWHDYERPAVQGTKRRGIGIAAHEWQGGTGNPPGYAWIKLNSDGTAQVVTGVQDIGTGVRTGLAQIAAEELGLPMKDVALQLGDTANAPYGPTSAGSATLATIGPAIRAAAADVKQQLLEAAALVLEEEPETLQVRDGMVFAAGGDPASGVTVAEVAGRLAPKMLQGQGARGPNPEDKTIRTFGVQCVEVEVDTATGEITLLRLVASHDCGRIINPKTVDSQIIGGVTQGIGFALTEARVIDAASGIVLNANLEEYKVPTVADVPPITHAPVDVPDLEANNTGAKGIGEPPLVPTAAAIANAVYDAVGVRLRHAPLSRRKLIEALAR